MKNVRNYQKIILWNLTALIVLFGGVNSSLAIPPKPPIDLPAYVPPTVLPAVNPARGTGPSGRLTNFNWQQEWGSIHMNSWVDGLQDPGAPASTQTRLPCAAGSVCENAGGLNKPNQTTLATMIKNGIKFDIKNSVMACMSEPIPQWPIENAWYPNAAGYGVCLQNLKMEESDYVNPKGVNQTGPFDAVSCPTCTSKIKITYMPIWDGRSNDASYHQSGGFVGCQQQIANGCYRDIHECVTRTKFDAAPVNTRIPRTSDGYKFPVSHIFTDEEKAMLNASIPGGLRNGELPTKYYRYTRDDTVVSSSSSSTSTSSSSSSSLNLKYGVLSVRDPRILPDNADLKMAAGTVVEVIDTTKEITSSGASVDNFLSNLKSYRMVNRNEQTNQDDSFVIVDSDFFDLNHYVDGGKWDSDYGNGSPHKFQAYRYSNGTLVNRPIPDQACPASKLVGGYSGICDPIPVSEGGAGCNLPIYKEGAVTTFKDQQNNEFDYPHLPIVWSGYVQKWAAITVSEFDQNILGREILYLNKTKLNTNPILMLTRAHDYCDPLERTSAEKLRLILGWNPSDHVIEPDMPCVQYLQYQKTGTDGTHAFVDLFNPSNNAFKKYRVAYTLMQLYDLKPDGTPDPLSPVAGTGENIYVSPPGYTNHNKGSMKYLSMKDVSKVCSGLGGPFYCYKDKDGTTLLPAVTKPDMKSPDKEMMGQDGMATVGQFLNANEKAMGAAIVLKPGTALAVRRQGANMDDWLLINGRPASCYVMVYEPEATQDLFVPSMSHEALQSYINSAAVKPDGTPGNIPHLYVRACTTHYFTKAEDEIERKLSSGGVCQKDNQGECVLDADKKKIVTGGLPAAINDLEALTTGAGAEAQTWVGKATCEALGAQRPACNQTKMISAYRYCRLENGDVGSCEECDGAPDPDATWLQDMMTRNNLANQGIAGKIIVDPTQNNIGKCYISVSCFNKNAVECPAAGTSGGHVFCFAPETKIEMADGSKKAIIDIKPGEDVVAFSAKNSRSASLGKSKVIATAITKKQQIIQINNTKLTGAHKIVLESGRSVRADEIKVGDKMLRSDNSLEPVTKIVTNLKPITVYNLVLEGGWDGYVANGLRVMSYPLMEELQK